MGKSRRHSSVNMEKCRNENAYHCSCYRVVKRIQVKKYTKYTNKTLLNNKMMKLQEIIAECTDTSIASLGVEAVVSAIVTRIVDNYAPFPGWTLDTDNLASAIIKRFTFDGITYQAGALQNVIDIRQSLVERLCVLLAIGNGDTDIAEIENAGLLAALHEKIQSEDNTVRNRVMGRLSSGAQRIRKAIDSMELVGESVLRILKESAERVKK